MRVTTLVFSSTTLRSSKISCSLILISRFPSGLWWYSSRLCALRHVFIILAWRESLEHGRRGCPLR
eukprot:12913131-Prorocentrum_lima.AAC.1